MPLLSANLVSRFQDQYQHKFKQVISAEEAERDLIGLADLVRLMIEKKEVKYGK